MKQLWSFGVVVNLFLFYSIFDIYFKSPIVPVNRRHKLDANVVRAPFKRVVFFSADGLRAETFLTHSNRRPYLTDIMKRQSCVWGISDTSVPTESRPGHVALFAGFNEDPSAVFTGWQTNTVEFDTVFNQSSSSIGLGSVDIIRMFAKGAAENKMFSASYPSQWQDFMANDLTYLDSWVFNYLVDMAKQEKLPKEEEVVIFLHLLGIDTIGHSKKPESDSYIKAMEYVDEIVQKTEPLINDYYGDNDTLYIFTSDHGMTNWGSHGDGSAHETETPFLVWGEGINKLSSEPVRLKQVDFAALMAGSLGIGFPSNSQGRFPYSFWEDKLFAFEALKSNFLQISDLMKTKKELIESNRNFPILLFQEEGLIQDKFKSAISKRNAKMYDEGMQILDEAINSTLDGVIYYERYDDQLLTIFIVCTNLCWILFISIIIVNISSSYKEIRSVQIFSLRDTLISLLVAPVLTTVVIGWSLWRFPYGFFPVYLVLLLVKLVGLRETGGDARLLNTRARLGTLFLLLVFCALGVEILVNSFDKRGALSIGLIVNAIWCVHAKRVSSWQKALFFVAVALLAIFPMMPVIGEKRSPVFMTLGPVVSTVLVGIFLYLRNKNSTMIHRRDQYILGGQLILLFLVSIFCHFPTLLFTRVIAWISLFQSYFLPIFTSPETVTGRLLSMFLAIASPFSLISFSYESLFLPSLFLVLMILLKIEMSEENLEDSWSEFLNISTESRERRKLWERVNLHQAVRRAWLHLFFVTLSFFGTGNIASVNSFDPSSTRCFVSVFNPWIMMMVLIEKILGPFLLVSCYFRRLLWSTMHIERSFLIVLLLCQGMGLHTFFMVKNQGSWLEIGTSISHHVIVNATTLCLFLLHFIADFIMSYEPRWCMAVKQRLTIPTINVKIQPIAWHPTTYTYSSWPEIKKAYQPCMHFEGTDFDETYL